MRQRHAELRVDVHHEARSSRSRDGEAPPQTYGTPRYCIAIPTTPPYREGGAAAIAASTSAAGDSSSARRPAGSPACARRVCAAAASGAAALGRHDLLDLAANRREEALPLGEPALDRLLACGLLGDDPRLVRARLRELRLRCWTPVRKVCTCSSTRASCCETRSTVSSRLRKSSRLVAPISISSVDAWPPEV